MTKSFRSDLASQLRVVKSARCIDQAFSALELLNFCRPHSIRADTAVGFDLRSSQKHACHTQMLKYSWIPSGTTWHNTEICHTSTPRNNEGLYTGDHPLFASCNGGQPQLAELKASAAAPRAPHLPCLGTNDATGD